MGNPQPLKFGDERGRGLTNKSSLSFCCQRAAGVSAHSLRALGALVNNQTSRGGEAMTVECRPGRYNSGELAFHSFSKNRCLTFTEAV